MNGIIVCYDLTKYILLDLLIHDNKSFTNLRSVCKLWKELLENYKILKEHELQINSVESIMFFRKYGIEINNFECIKICLKFNLGIETLKFTNQDNMKHLNELRHTLKTENAFETELLLNDNDKSKYNPINGVHDLTTNYYELCNIANTIYKNHIKTDALFTIESFRKTKTDLLVMINPLKYIDIFTTNCLENNLLRNRIILGMKQRLEDCKNICKKMLDNPRLPLQRYNNIIYLCMNNSMFKKELNKSDYQFFMRIALQRGDTKVSDDIYNNILS